MAVSPESGNPSAAEWVRKRTRTVVSPGTRAWIRRKQGRLRWMRKYRRARSFGRSLRHEPRMFLGFVLTDPEVENFTYEIANEDQLIGFLADAVSVSRDEIASYFEEGHRDPVMNAELRRRMRWRWDTKTQPPLGRRLGWYALIRALRPSTVVETGIHNGLGSLVLLRALQRNAEAGDRGQLISFDPVKGTGWIVPEKLRGVWRPVYESTFDALDPTLSGESVDLLFQDTGAGYEAELHDYETVLRHAAPRVVLVAASAHLTTALRDLSAVRGLAYHHFLDVSRDHVFPGGATGLAVSERASAGDG